MKNTLTIYAQDNKMKKALLIIDIQEDYFEGGANPLTGSLEASLNAKKILEEFRKENHPVVHIQHLSTRPGSTFFVSGTRGAEIHPNVGPLPEEKVIIKHYPNSFRETDLLDYLRSDGITELVVCGMMTHMCVDATVRAAKDYGFVCTLIADACATRALVVNGETVKAHDVQNAFLAALAYFYSTVITTEDYLSAFLL